MAELQVTEGRIHWEEAGVGVPLVLVHGSWDEVAVWHQVVPRLARSFRVVVYDRRGHGESTGRGPLDTHVQDLAAVLEQTGAPAHVAANSLGGSIALRLATRRPELLQSLAVHEPPLVDLLGQDHPAIAELRSRLAGVLEHLAAGRMKEGARQFVEQVVLGPGAWDTLPSEARDMMARNAHTFLEENQDPTQLSIDRAALEQVPVPVLLSGGDDSPPFFAEILDILETSIPRTRRETIAGAGHIPHETHPEPYAELLRGFAERTTR
jgi:pimeloyl-ACP methyl ester carboxylesterase